MAYREYIGSRYVPIFGRKNEDTIQWDNGSSYEPLTIVLHEGNSYTSRQYVPAGVDIHDETFWALTGNYNAQIEQYRETVQAFDSRIAEAEEAAGEANTKAVEAKEQADTNKGDIESLQQAVAAIPAAQYTNGKLRVRESGSVNGTSTLVDCDGEWFTLIDCGTKHTITPENNPPHTVDDNASILNWLSGVLGTRKLNALVISHFHPDHIGAMETVLSNFCDINTDIYIQMELLQSDGISDHDYYRDAVNDLYTYCRDTDHLRKTPVVPTDSYPIVYTRQGGIPVTLTFYNTDTYNKPHYNVTSDNGYGNADKSLNNYSLITRVDYANSSYVNTGDVETPAQYYNYAKMEPCTFASYPHHGVNMMGFYEFFNALGTKFWHMTKALDVQHNLKTIVQSVENRYLIRYSMQIAMPFMYVNTADLECVMQMGVITKLVGDHFSIPSVKDNTNNVPLISSVLPKATEFSLTDPYVIATYDMRKIAQEAAELNGSHPCHLNGAVDYIQAMTAYTEIATVFNWNTENNVNIANNPVFYINAGTDPVHVYTASDQMMMSAFEYTVGFDFSVFPDTNWKPVYPTRGGVAKFDNLSMVQGNELVYDISNPQDEHYAENLANAKRLRQLFRNNNLLVQCDVTFEVEGTQQTYQINVPLNRRATNQWSGITNVGSARWLFVDLRHEPYGTWNKCTLAGLYFLKFDGTSGGTAVVKQIINPLSI